MVTDDQQAERDFLVSRGADLTDLPGQIYFNGLSTFCVVAIDHANPGSHVIVEHLATGALCPVAASAVRRWLASFPVGVENTGIDELKEGQRV